MSARLPEPPACGTSLIVLSRFHDGDSVGPALERHITTCPDCRTALHDIGSTATAVAGMSGVPHVRARIETTTARQSRVEMADFVHELALACLQAVPGTPGAFAGLHLPHETRSFAEVSADIRSLHRRMAQMGHELALVGLPAAAPHGEHALPAARACLVLLAALEGPSERHRLALAAAHERRAGSTS